MEENQPRPDQFGGFSGSEGPNVIFHILTRGIGPSSYDRPQPRRVVDSRSEIPAQWAVSIQSQAFAAPRVRIPPTGSVKIARLDSLPHSKVSKPWKTRE